MKQDAMDEILRRVAASPAADRWVLRGGLLSQWWCLPARRPADDIDFLALYPFDQAQTDALVAGLGLTQAAPTEIIWEETDSPGLRYQLCVGTQTIQLDLGFGDPLPSPPVWWDHPAGARVLTVPPAVGIAWKLHGLFEFDDGHWRPKDLHDLLLFFENADIDHDNLPAAIRLAFDSRDTPLALVDRLLCGELGRSRGSRSGWQALTEKREAVPPLQDVIARVGEHVRPHVEALHPPLSQPPSETRYPRIEHIDDVLPAIRGDRAFVHHRQPGIVVLNAERVSKTTFPDATDDVRIRRHRLLRRECRGLVFDEDGRLLARRYHKFFQLHERPIDLGDGAPLILEKLDGAMLSPALLPEGLRLLSRRGRSDLADAAERFARDGHRALWSTWTEAGWTPILEWCHRDHRIVIDHPQPRLVLTAIRRRADGAYLSYADLVDTAHDHGVEVVRSHGRLDDLKALVRTVEASRGREGVVLRADDGRMVKLKSLQYRRLHRAREATERERARFEVLLSGEADLLRPLLPADEANHLDALDGRVQAALAAHTARLSEEVARCRAEGTTSAELAGSIRHRPGIERSVLFASLRGEEVGACLRARIRKDVASARRLAELRVWLGL